MQEEINYNTEVQALRPERSCTQENWFQKQKDTCYSICLSRCIMLSDNCSKYSSHLFINIQLGQFTVSQSRQTLLGKGNQDKIFL